MIRIPARIHSKPCCPQAMMELEDDVAGALVMGLLRLEA